MNWTFLFWTLSVDPSETTATVEPIGEDFIHWKPAGIPDDAVPALVQLMYSDNEELQAVAASVLCNISQEDEVRVALTTSNAAEILIKRLMSPNEDIQSRSAIILSDIAYVDGNQSLISDKGGIEPLVELMDSEGHDVLVNAVNAVRVLCDGNEYNQTAISDCGGIPPLVEFLTLINFADGFQNGCQELGSKYNMNWMLAWKSFR